MTENHQQPPSGFTGICEFCGRADLRLQDIYNNYKCKHCGTVSGTGIYGWKMLRGIFAPPLDSLLDSAVVRQGNVDVVAFALKALENVGVDTQCGACMAVAFTGAAPGVLHVCRTNLNYAADK